MFVCFDAYESVSLFVCLLSIYLLMSLYSLSVFTVITSLSSKELYSILIPNTLNKPTSNIYFEKLLENTTLDWSKIYSSLSLATINTTFRSFQFNVLFLNKKLHAFGITNAVLDSVRALKITFYQ